MFGLADPGDDWSYMNRSKYTEKFIAAHLNLLPEYAGSADTHFDAVRPMNHALRHSGGLHAEERLPDAARTAGRAGPDAGQRLGDQVNTSQARRVRRGRVAPSLSIPALVGLGLASASAVTLRGRRRLPRARRRESAGGCSSISRSRRQARCRARPVTIRDHAYAPAERRAVQLGGPTLSLPARARCRRCATIEYTPPYADLLDNPDGISAPGPGGGFTRDGRASTLADQARIPLLAPNEMANASPAAVVRAIRASAVRAAVRAGLWRGVVRRRPATAFKNALDALQAFQLEDDSFHPYSSKYDLYASQQDRRQADAQRAARVSAVYNDPNKGNCFACHFNGAGIGGSVRLFTDYTYAAIGVPRNAEIPANRDPSYFDLGICGRPDHPLPANARYCGMFKTPTLRNVATRRVFFHNGRFKSLRDVIRFYNTRDTNPELWYPIVAGVVQKWDDLPRAYRDQHRQADAARRPAARKPAADDRPGDDGSRSVSQHPDRR